MMHGLHYHGYSMSLFIVQMGILCYYFKKSPAVSSKFNLSLFFIGFLQGLIGFDYVFLVSLAAIPFFVLYSSPHNGIGRSKLLFSMLFPFLGFAFAHFLHFMQVCLYYESIQKGFSDILGAASYSYQKGLHETFSQSIYGRLQVLKSYFIRFESWKYFGMSLIIIYVLSLLMLIKEADILIHRPLKLYLQWKSSLKNYLPILLSFLISSLWVVIMRQHASEHVHFLPRHYFFMYFFLLLTTVECLKTMDSV
jgi:hypothetical protein